MDVQELIKQQVTSHPVVLYMKGVPTFPQCGFSASAVRILQALGVKEFFSVDVLTNQGSNNVSVIDTATNAVVATVALGIFPRHFRPVHRPRPRRSDHSHSDLVRVGRDAAGWDAGPVRDGRHAAALRGGAVVGAYQNGELQGLVGKRI